VHILCLGITPADHEWLQAPSDDVESWPTTCTSRRSPCALAHPFYAVEAPLLPRHRRRLAQLFDIWEAQRLRAVSSTSGRDLRRDARRTGVGRSDDHAAVDSAARGRRRRGASTPAEPRPHPRRAGSAHGEQGSAASGRTRDGARDRALGRGDGTAVRMPPPSADGRAGDDGGRRAHPAPSAATRPGGRARSAARLAGRGRPAHERARAARAAAVRRVSHATRARAGGTTSRRLKHAVETAVSIRADRPAASELFTACFAGSPTRPPRRSSGREKGKLGPAR